MSQNSTPLVAARSLITQEHPNAPCSTHMFCMRTFIFSQISTQLVSSAFSYAVRTTFSANPRKISSLRLHMGWGTSVRHNLATTFFSDLTSPSTSVGYRRRHLTVHMSDTLWLHVKELMDAYLAGYAHTCNAHACTNTQPYATDLLWSSAQKPDLAATKF